MQSVPKSAVSKTADTRARRAQYLAKVLIFASNALAAANDIDTLNFMLDYAVKAVLAQKNTVASNVEEDSNND